MQVADLSQAARPVRRAERFFANGRVDGGALALVLLLVVGAVWMALKRDE